MNSILQVSTSAGDVLAQGTHAQGGSSAFLGHRDDSQDTKYFQGRTGAGNGPVGG